MQKCRYKQTIHINDSIDVFLAVLVDELATANMLMC